MNSRLPTTNNTSHYWADQSRNLILCIESINILYYKLLDTECSFEIDSYYEKVFQNCQNFLSKSGGSTIPPKTLKIELYYKKYIFVQKNVTTIKHLQPISYNRKLVGEGSYAKVFKYNDDFYNRKFIVKKAKKI